MRTTPWIALGALVLAACSPAPPEARSRPTPTKEPAASESPTSRPEGEPTDTSAEVKVNRRVEDFDGTVPPQLIPPDGIPPVYEPQFQSAAEAPLRDEELVIGVALDGEAKAYPITVLRSREMVNDEMAGIPTLVTW